MKWITAADLELWAKSLGARTELPQIISDLIRASVPDIASIRFPSGDKGQIRGFDGHLISNVSAMNVPLGESFWEIGTNVDYQGKATGDFDKRTGEVSEQVQRNSTYVFVSPRTWDSSLKNNKIEDFVRARKESSSWKDVLYLDGVVLETWLQEHPAVSAYHAWNTLKVRPVDGVLSTDEFWAAYAGRFRFPLTEEVLLCERESEAARLVEELLKPANAIVVAADSPDEALAFAVSAMKKAPPEQRLFLEAKTLIVDSSAAGRLLPPRGKLVLLLRHDASKSAMQFSAMGTTLVPLGRHQPGVGAINLSRPTAHAMGLAMRSMGLDENLAITYARGSGRSLAALARLIPSGSYDPPAWTRRGDELLSAILAGAWDSTNSKDRDIVKRLAGGVECSQVEAKVRFHLNEVDPPFDLEGPVWKVRAPMDAFIHVGSLIGPEQAERLRSVMVEAFAEVEPEPDPDELFSLSRRGSSLCSDWLREGLATTLLLLAVWSETARVNLGAESGQSFANRTLQELPGLNSDPRLLSALRDELPLLAEAAPGPLLLALEHMLEGDGSIIKPIFVERKGVLTPTSLHTGVLWALETMAWDPEYFRRSVLILARLAIVDPGGHLSNRPMNSLVEIFLPWAPNTNASSGQRLAALDEVIRGYPAVAWELLLKLMPTALGFSSPTAKPRLREAGAADRKPVTNREYWSIQTALCDRAIALAANDRSRWERLIRGISSFPPDSRRRALESLDSLLTNLEAADRKMIWSRVRDEVSRHERFQSAGWALSGADLAPFKLLVERYAPADPVVALSQLFGDRALEDANSSLQKGRRREALLQLISKEGLSGVVRLVKEVRLTYVVLDTISDCDLKEAELRELLELSFRDDPVSSFTIGLSGIYRGVVGQQQGLFWLKSVLAGGEVAPEIVAALLENWPNDRATWRAVSSLGNEVAAAYWRQLSPRYLKGSRSELLRSTLMRLRYGRPISALQSCLDRLGEIPTRLILRILDSVIPELNSRDQSADTMITYYVAKALEALDQREDVQDTEIARREYQLFPLIEHEDRKLRIYKVMAGDPKIFQELLRNVFRADDEEGGDVTDLEKANAQVSYRLLSGFDRLPGYDRQQVSGETLSEWIDDFRRIGIETKRAEITDSYVGKILAHAPPDENGVWPHEAVRTEIERLASTKIESALQIERYNMRGVHSRGVYDGGAQERELAKTAFDAAEVCERWPRTAELLRSIARNWEAEAKAADLEAAQRRLRS
jgi:hypothetical protein